MMAANARLFGDGKMLAETLKAADPKEAKALGVAVQNFDDEVWKANCRKLCGTNGIKNAPNSSPIAA
jgi:predicted NAD-dependent protein-ADP-ribosyltransferase YbiA (DUF1768 family)